MYLLHPDNDNKSIEQRRLEFEKMDSKIATFMLLTAAIFILAVWYSVAGYYAG